MRVGWQLQALATCQSQMSQLFISGKVKLPGPALSGCAPPTYSTTSSAQERLWGRGRPIQCHSVVRLQRVHERGLWRTLQVALASLSPLRTTSTTLLRRYFRRRPQEVVLRRHGHLPAVLRCLPV
jgi:hypothetical protein